MKIKYFFSILFILNLSHSLNAQVLWDGGQFNGGLGDWTTEGISNDTATWRYTADGSGLSYLVEDMIINSPSVSNGAAIFDASFYSRDLTAPPFPIHNGSLISPVIDCSSFSNIDLRFYQKPLLNSPSNLLQFAYSIDGGMTWSPYRIIPTLNTLAAGQIIVITEEVRFPINEIAGAANVQLKFTWEGSFLMWLLDDVQLLQRNINDLFLDPKNFAIAPNLLCPSSQVEPFSFLAEFTNKDNTEAPNVDLGIEIINNSLDTIYSDLVLFDIVHPDSIYQQAFSGSFTPPSTVGTYTGLYSLGYDLEFDPSDNNLSFDFEITENIFSKVVEPQFATRPSDAVWSGNPLHHWMFGNYYHIVNGSDITPIGSEWYAESITFNCEDIAEGNTVQVALYKWIADTNGNQQVEVDEREKVGTATYTATGNETVEEDITLVLNPVGSENGDAGFIKLDSDQAYLALMEFIAQSPEDDIDIGVNQDISYEYQALRTDPTLFGDLPYRPTIVIGIGTPEEAVLLTNPPNWNFIPTIDLKITQKEPVKIQELDAANLLTLTPNPASDFVNLQVAFVRLQKEITVRITDQQGKLYTVKNFEDIQQQSLRLDTEALPSGMYFINIQTAEGQRTESLIIQR